KEEYPDTEEARDMIKEFLFMAMLALAQKAQRLGRGALISTEPSSSANGAPSLQQEPPAKRTRTAPLIDSTFRPGMYCADFQPASSMRSINDDGTPMESSSASALFGLSGGDSGGSPPDRVKWGDILEEVGIPDMVYEKVGAEQGQRVLRKVRMRCGLAFIRKFNRAKKDPISGHRYYVETDRSDMRWVAEQMSSVIAQRGPGALATLKANKAFLSPPLSILSLCKEKSTKPRTSSAARATSATLAHPAKTDSPSASAVATN
ncbi:unnamed protein product, partial [Durusdinium trenchii]